jgi:hypothetical protein
MARIRGRIVSFYIHRVVGSRTVLTSVEREALRIGRGAGADLRFEDTAVALEHALIRQGAGGGYEIHDLGSVTGTYVNGEQVASARLADGDEIGVGGWLLRVRRSDPEDPLFLHVRPAEAEPRPDAAPVAVPRVDYAGSYRLRRGLLNKPFLALAGCLAALLAVAALPAVRQLDAFRPGELTSFHDEEAIEASSCSACHTPFLGVSDARCQDCHGPGGRDETPAHRSAAVAGRSLRCTACHLEHLGTDGLTAAGDDRCIDCHRDLERAVGASEAAPAFARSVTSFAGDHPELALTVVESGVARRVLVTDPALRRADPTVVRMNHAKHLKPDLVTLNGRETLTCERCHRPATAEDGAPTGLMPIRFDAVCAECHALTFDDRYPDLTAPHGAPEELRGFLYAVYQDREMSDVSVPDRRRGVLPDPGRRDFEPRLLQEAIEAENRLYQQKCLQCHRIDLAATPYPEVEPPRIPDRWFPHGRFDHADHAAPRVEGLECADCHAGARTSETAADLLLPGIASCTPCHGGARTAAAGVDPPFPVTPGPSGCRTCHVYHSRADFPAGPLARLSEPGTPSAADPTRGGS